MGNLTTIFMDGVLNIFLEFLRKQAGIVIVLIFVVFGLVYLISYLDIKNDSQHNLLRSEMGEVKQRLNGCLLDKENLLVRLGRAEVEIELIRRRK